MDYDRIALKYIFELDRIRNWKKNILSRLWYRGFESWFKTVVFLVDMKQGP